MKKLLLLTAMWMVVSAAASQTNVVVKYSVGNNYGKEMTI